MDNGDGAANGDGARAERGVVAGEPGRKVTVLGDEEDVEEARDAHATPPSAACQNAHRAHRASCSRAVLDGLNMNGNGVHPAGRLSSGALRTCRAHAKHLSVRDADTVPQEPPRDVCLAPVLRRDVARAPTTSLFGRNRPPPS